METKEAQKNRIIPISVSRVFLWISEFAKSTVPAIDKMANSETTQHIITLILFLNFYVGFDGLLSIGAIVFVYMALFFLVIFVREQSSNSEVKTGFKSLLVFVVLISVSLGYTRADHIKDKEHEVVLFVENSVVGSSDIVRGNIFGYSDDGLFFFESSTKRNLFVTWSSINKIESERSTLFNRLGRYLEIAALKDWQ